MIDWIRALPKAELHVHIEGTLEPELAFRLAERNKIILPFRDVRELRKSYAFDDLQSFLKLYYECMNVLRTPADFDELASTYLSRAALDGVNHVELFFDPQAHTSRGIPLADVIAGLNAAAKRAPERHGISVMLIACFLRDQPVSDAMSTLELLSGYTDIVHGIGLDSAEIGHPPSDFRQVFAAAEQLGFHRVAHAGEEGPPRYIWEAIDVLGAERVDHGIRAVEDPALLNRLAVDQIPLTVCPLSNLRLRCVDTLEDHPLPALLDAGVLVTINSDDPAYFGGYVADNYVAVQQALRLESGIVELLARNSLHASFSLSERNRLES
ncbi:adenosine deaminase [Mycobacteroides abscessus subsp. abscessus]|uniref:adenosine deaminase n=1 Tax=Mycobacteroides abscessus TaxID=36809 RepID=UPI00092B06AB|nr:adenosine deaminase [Mycobacteroides abscessus]SIK10785.1 adenosine deaminase [Mycobacteroides abscessus subsp. abscessus]SKF60040.1 adenosine deaminase [Mycobacteroides abscessus subsp. abscessus]